MSLRGHRTTGPLERKKAFRILKRLATNPIREDQTSKVDHQKIQEDIAWAKAVISDFDIALTTSNSNKQEGQDNQDGTWSRF